MSELSKSKPQWIRDTGLIAVSLPPSPALQKYAGGQRSDFDASYEQNFSDAALDSLVRAGVTLVYVRFFSGFGIEFEKNETERLRDYIGRAHARGIKVGAAIALGTVTPETLLIEESDAQNWLQFNGDGRTIAPDNHVYLWRNDYAATSLTAARPCYNSESFMRYIERVCGTAVDFGADLIYFDTIGYNPEPDTCRCPICVGLFREFLRQQYGVQDDKTRHAGKERFGHNTFTHTRPPAYSDANANSSLEIDAPHEQEWIRFKAHTLAQCLARLSRAIFKRNPQCAVGSDVLAATPAAEAAHALNPAALLQHLDIAGLARRTDLIDTEPYSAERNAPAALRGVQDGADPRQSYQAQDADEMPASESLDDFQENVAPAHSTAIRSFKIARAYGAALESALDPAALETSLALQLAFNNRGLGVAGDALSPWFGPGWEHRVDGDASLKILRAYVGLYARLKQLLLLDARTLATLGVVRDPASLTFDAANNAAQIEFEDLLIQENIPFDIVYPQHLDDLSKYRGLALAGCEALSDDIVRKIERFVNAGGGVVAFGDAGRRDEWRRVRTQPALSSILGSEYPQAHRRTVGSGRAGYAPSSSGQSVAELIDLLEYTCGSALPVKAEFASGHAIVEGSSTRSGSIAIHAVNASSTPAKGVRFTLLCESAPKQAFAYHATGGGDAGRETSVPVQWDNGRATFEADEIATYTLFEVRF